MVTNKNTKIILAIIIIVIIAIAGYYLYGNYQKQKRINDINDYKKGFYEGMLCEYNCPMTSQEYKNKTQMLPELDCVKGCTGPFKEKFADVSYTMVEIENDNLLKDIDDEINKCKTSSVNMTSLALNNTLYFSCAAQGLEGLKQNYSYLA